MDIRDPRLIDQGQQIFEKVLKNKNLQVKIVFLDCSDDVLIRRYKDTRRKHPMAQENTISKGIQAERSRLGWIMSMADIKMDTSDLNIHQLRAKARQLLSLPDKEIEFNFQFVSFGFKYGLPPDADMVMDVRFLPNPHWVPDLRPKTGKNSQVVDYIFNFDIAKEFLDTFHKQLLKLVPYYLNEGKNYLTVAIGCTGGRHRSVAVTEALAHKALNPKMAVTVYHRDVAKS